MGQDRTRDRALLPEGETTITSDNSIALAALGLASSKAVGTRLGPTIGDLDVRSEGRGLGRDDDRGQARRYPRADDPSEPPALAGTVDDDNSGLYM
jgi:hypothetical protein